MEEKKLWRDEDDEYFKHINRIIRIERNSNMFKDCIDEIIYLQDKIKELELKEKDASLENDGGIKK